MCLSGISEEGFLEWTTGLKKGEWLRIDTSQWILPVFAAFFTGRFETPASVDRSARLNGEVDLQIKQFYCLTKPMFVTW